MIMKTCKKCLTPFDQRNCPTCQKTYNAAWRKANLEKVRDYNAAYRKANLGNLSAYYAEWYTANPEKVRARAKVWAKANPSKHRAHAAAYRKANPEKCLARVEAWKKANPDKCNATTMRRNATKLNATPAWASQGYITLWYKLAKMEEARTGKKCHVDHIVPLRSKLVCGLHCEDNMQILFAGPNITKGNRHWPDMPDIHTIQNLTGEH